MLWAAHRGCPRGDLTACIWLIRRFIDPDASFVFFGDPAEAPEGAELCGVLSLKIVFPDCVAKGDLNDPNLQPVDPTSNYRAGALKNEVTGQVMDPDTGQVIDSPDHESHMVRSLLRNGARVCPSAYPIPVPTLTVNISNVHESPPRIPA